MRTNERSNNNFEKDPPVVEKRKVQVKSSYYSPCLIQYGNVSTLTKGQNGSANDGSSGMAMV